MRLLLGSGIKENQVMSEELQSSTDILASDACWILACNVMVSHASNDAGVIGQNVASPVVYHDPRVSVHPIGLWVILVWLYTPTRFWRRLTVYNHCLSFWINIAPDCPMLYTEKITKKMMAKNTHQRTNNFDCMIRRCISCHILLLMPVFCGCKGLSHSMVTRCKYNLNGGSQLSIPDYMDMGFVEITGSMLFLRG